LLAAFVCLLLGRAFISTAPIVDSSNVSMRADETGRNDPVFLFSDAEPLPALAEDEGSTTSAPAQVEEASEVEQASEGMASSPGLGSMAHWWALIGILLVAIGYGMYQPGAYAAVRQFTTPKTAAMGFAMLYALMNLGGWIPSLAPLLRTDEVKFRSWSIPGTGVGVLGMIWVYTGLTAVSLLLTWLILSRRTVETAIATAKAGRELEKQESAKNAGEEAAETAEGEKGTKTNGGDFGDGPSDEKLKIPLQLWGCLVVALVPVYWIPDAKGVPWRFILWGVLILGPVLIALLPANIRTPIVRWIARHPLADGKFFFFIFCLIPVQTLFAHNWLTLPMYVERAYRESWPWISQNWEAASNFNPLLIFVFVPIIAAVTQKANVYNMMIYGTLVMAAPTFLLSIGPYWWTLLAYLVIMTIGEAMWQPRFLQYAAEIAPEGRTGVYMGVAQFPWFLTKVIVPLYAGRFLLNYCPEEGVRNTETMWLVYGCIAMTSTVMLILAKRWVGKDFKTKAD
jgi:hypothetical protein